MMRNKLLLLIVCAFIGTGSVNANELRATLNKSEYLLYEPIWVRWCLVNTTEDTIKSEGGFISSQQYMLLDEKGNKYHWGHFVETGPQLWYDLILPHDSITNEFNVMDCNLLEGFGKLPVGEYSFSVVVNPELKSDAIRFIILRSSDEDIATRIEKYHDPNNHNVYDLIKQCELFIADYPNSVYAPYMSFHLSSLRWNIDFDTNKHDVILKDLILKYPDEPMSANMLVTRLNGAENTSKMIFQEWIDFSQKIYTEKPNTLVGHVVHECFNRLIATGKMFGFGAWPWAPIPKNKRTTGYKYPDKP